ncbi:MAG: Flp pilus assembly complex ATPase component TadA [Lachnospiraceae bacterium]|nr:Flp pilus assembly complex ATPase component TadA [Lachnospiraceae bacterium]
MDISSIKNVRLGDVLVEQGVITAEQLNDVLAYQKEHHGERMGQILISQQIITEKQMLMALGTRLNIHLVDVSMMTVNLEAVALIPQQMAEQYNMLPVYLEGDNVGLVVNDPLNLYGIEDIRQTTSKNVSLMLAEAEPLRDAIRYYYSDVKAKNAANRVNKESESENRVDELVIDTEAGADDTPIINLVNSLLDKAYTDNASDIHIEPQEKETVIRMRFDGAMMEYVKVQKSIHASLTARIKIMSDLDIAEHRIPQDGHFRIKLREQIVNVRVSTIPTTFGEKTVMRLLASNAKIDYEDHFGMNDENYEKFMRMLRSPNGIIYLTGPTGSGKSTTLYMALAELTKRPVNISTIEDPVEKNVPKLNQMQVNNQAGLTFDVGLRALLRQDPDIIMVGETRDNETASISVRAAITGHLVLSTLHTNDAASSVIRLVDMGLEPYLISSALVGLVAQRLMRKVCPHCATRYNMTESDEAFVGRRLNTLKYGRGCTKCNGTGYIGRIAIHEMIEIDQNIREMISRKASTADIKKYAIEEQGMKTLKQAGIELLEQGISTMEELRRVAYYE